MNLNRDFDNIPEALEQIKNHDITKYIELLIEYMKANALNDINYNLLEINNNLLDIEINSRS